MINRPIPKTAKIGIVGLLTILITAAILLPMAQAQKKPAQSPTLQTATNGLIAYYPFEGDATDVSGNNNHGSRQGTVDYTSGVVGKSARFYGIDDRGYIKVSNSENLKLTDVVTIALWVRIEDGAGQTGLDGSGRKVPDAHQVFVAKSGDRVGFVVHSTRETADKRYIGMEAHNHTPRESGAYFAPEEPLKTWMHMAVTSGDSGTKLYYNGELVRTDNRPTDLSEANPEDLYIGIQAGKGSLLPGWFPLNGMIDELRIYNRALSAEEVKSLYDNDSAGVGNVSKRSKFEATLPNGVTVELVGVCEHPSKGKQWWRPDGSYLDTPCASLNPKGLNVSKSNIAYELVTRLSGSESLRIRTWAPERWEIKDAKKVGLGRSGTGKDKEGKSLPYLRATTAIIRKNLKKIDIKFGIVPDIWETKLSVSPDDNTTRKIKEYGIRIKPPYENEGNSVVTIKIPNRTDRKAVVRVVAHLRNGSINENAAWNRDGKISFMDSTDHYEFYGLKLADVDHFEIRIGEYQWVEFQNVSLKPNSKTDVQIEVPKTEINNLDLTDTSRQKNDRRIKEMVNSLRDIHLSKDREKWFS